MNEKIRAEDVPYKGLTDLLQDWKESGKYNINSYYGTRRETTVRCQTEEDCEKVSAALAAEGYDLEDFDIYAAVRVNIGMVPVSVGEDGLVCLQGSLRGFDKNSDGNYTITVINVPLDKPLLEEQLGTKIEMEPGKEYTLVLPPDFKVDGNSRWGSQVSDFEDIYGVVDIYGRLDTTGENPERFVEVEKIVFRRRVYDDEFADDVLD